MQRISFIQWIIHLIKRDMKEYKEDEREKQKIYDAVQKKIKK